MQIKVLKFLRFSLLANTRDMNIWIFGTHSYFFFPHDFEPFHVLVTFDFKLKLKF